MPLKVKDIMKKGDLHLVGSRSGHTLKAYNYEGHLKWVVKARFDGAYGPGEDRVGGDTPLGVYKVGAQYIQDNGTDLYNIYGPYFYDLESLENQEEKYGRAGVGLHGGRDKSPGRPPKSWVDLNVTHGCVRVDNDDLSLIIAPAIKERRREGFVVYMSVVA